jgi:predicted phosphodiesterase
MNGFGEGESIVVLGDIHGNARALRRALALVDGGPHDRVVVLGDLLTYGPDVTEVVALIGDAQARWGAVLLVGNHDQLYFDLPEGRCEYYAGLPEWLRESIDWTFSRLDPAAFASALRWQQELVVDDLLFAHANPFGFGDWRYLNSEADHAAAAMRLAERSLRVGVFGHTHRGKMFLASDGASPCELRDAVDATFNLYRLGDGRLVVNAGSVGQPRSRRGEAFMLRITRARDTLGLAFQRIDYDVVAHLAALRALPLTEATRDRLCRFHSHNLGRM